MNKLMANEVYIILCPGGIRIVSPVGRFARSIRPGSFCPCFRGGSIRPY